MQKIATKVFNSNKYLVTFLVTYLLTQWPLATDANKTSLSCYNKP